MQFNLDLDSASYSIRAYRPGEITLTLPQRQAGSEGGPLETETIAGSLILSPAQLIRDWAPRHIHELLAEHLEAIAELQPEVVLLGTGEHLDFPATEVLAVLHNRQVGVEIMDTAAACRTYNILMAEGRKVAAGLINPA